MPGRSPGLIESACVETGRGAEAIPGHDATSSERGARVAAEQQRLRAWAEANGKLRGKLPREDFRGSEHTVQIPGDTEKANARVIKATRPDANQGYGISYGSYSQGASPSEYLDRLSTQNRIFDDDMRLERICSRWQQTVNCNIPAVHQGPWRHIAGNRLFHAREGF
jgi:hypothetical protein